MNVQSRMKSFLKLPARRNDLHELVAAGDLPGLRVALQSSADVNKQDKNGKTPLHIAVEHGYEAMVRELLSRRADVTIQDGDDQNSLHIAAFKQYSKIMTLLLAELDHVNDQRKVLNTRNSYGYTTLMEAAKRGSVQMVQTMLARGADPFKVGNDGKNALHLAAQSGQLPLVELLVYQAGLDVNVPIRGTHSRALHHAARRGDVQMVQLLLAAGADSSLRNEHGEVAVQLAEENQQFSVVSVIQRHERQVVGQPSVGSPRAASNGTSAGGWDEHEPLPHSHQLADLRGSLQELSIPSPSHTSGRSNWASPPGHRRHSSLASNDSPSYSGGNSRQGNRASPAEPSSASSTSRHRRTGGSVTDYEPVVIPPPAEWTSPFAGRPPSARPLSQPPPESPSLPLPSTPATPSPGPALSAPIPNSDRGMPSAGSAGSASSSRWGMSPSTPSMHEPVYIPPPTNWNTGPSLLPRPRGLIEALGIEEEEEEEDAPQEHTPPRQAAPQRHNPQAQRETPPSQRHTLPPASPTPTPPVAPRAKLAQSLPEHVAVPPAEAHDSGPLSAGRLPPRPQGQAAAASRITHPSPPPRDHHHQQVPTSPEPLVACSPLAANRPRLPSSAGSTPPATSPRDPETPAPLPSANRAAARPAAAGRATTASPSPSPSPKQPPADPESRSLLSLTQEAAATRAQANGRSPASGQASSRDTSTQRDNSHLTNHSQLPSSPAVPRPVPPPAARRATADLAWEAITSSSSPPDDDAPLPTLAQRRHTTSDLPLRPLGQQLPTDARPPIVQALRAGPAITSPHSTSASPTTTTTTSAPRHRTVAQLQLEQQQLPPKLATPSSRPASVLSPTSSGSMSPSGSRRAAPPPAFDPDKPFFHFLLQANGGKQP